MKGGGRTGLKTLLLVLLGLQWAPPAHARNEDDCKRAWSRAVRSYLTQNRKASPSGEVPKDLDAEERSAQAWLDVFKAACRQEKEGQKSEARIEASLAGAQVLVKLDPRACVQFMSAYMGASSPQDICQKIPRGSSETLRALLRSSLPPR